jgi:DNA-binding NarL/FixJ family response regulator
MNPSNRRIRTLIADDSRTVLLSVCRYLEFERDFEVVATATDGLQLLHKTERYRPDLALTDLSMPRISELEAPMALSKRATCLKNLMSSKMTLLVDDSCTARLVNRMIFGQKSNYVLAAIDGKEAVERE